MSTRSAIRAEREGRVGDAILLYRAAIEEDPSDVRATVNLACLLWCLEDLGNPDIRRVPQDILATCDRPPIELLAGVVERRPDSTRAAFWLHYLRSMASGPDVDPEQCRRWLAVPNSALDPAMGLISATSGAEGHREGLMLMSVCLHEGTALARYVVSIVSGVMRRLAAAEHRNPRA